MSNRAADCQPIVSQAAVQTGSAAQSRPQAGQASLQDKSGCRTQTKYDRLIVQSPWMGDRFETILRRAPSDLRLLFSSVTSIELVGDIAGDSYRNWSGGIRMSAQSLWRSQDERDTLNLTDIPDTRFATSLLLRHSWSNIRSGQSYDEFNRRSANRLWNNERDIDQIYLAFVDRLYHELAHAATNMNLNSLSQLDPLQTAVQVLFAVPAPEIEVQLNEQFPLNAVRLHEVATGYYTTRPVRDSITRLTVADVATEFENDGALELYSYFSNNEDIATLFAATMMKFHYNTQKTLGFAIKPDGAVSCENIVLEWGVRDRLANPVVKQRAQFVANFIFSNRVDFNGFFNGISNNEQAVLAGTNWCEVRGE